MAQKRMFDKSIIETDDFADLPMSAKALYFLLGMEADDEGFVSPQRVIRAYGGTADDLKVLMAKRYCIQFKSGVVVLTHFKQNNWLDSRRITPTRYVEEKSLIEENPNKEYCLKDPGLANAKPLLSQYSIEENRIEQNSIEENRGGQKRKKYSSVDDLSEEDFVLLANDYQVPTAFVKSKHEDLVNYQKSTGKTYKDYLATLRNWVKKDAIQIRKEANANIKRGIDARNI